MRGRTGGVFVYATAAVAARSADAGAIVAAVLAGTAVAGPAAGGLLAAALTVPHLVGPLAGRLLDARRRPGPVLAAAFAWYAVFVVLAAVLLPVTVAGAAVALAGAGCAGPLVTGGLSSRLAGIVQTEGRAQRRGHALDALTYGVSATIGPAAVAVAATTLSPSGALAGTALLLTLAAVVVLWLPSGANAASRAASGSVLRLLVVHAPLRRTTIATIGSAAALAAAPVIATAFAAQRGSDPAAAAVLMSLYGAGGLVASVVLVARPLTGDPERLVRVGVAFTGAALLLPLLALPMPQAGTAIGGVAFALIGAASSALLAATLAARTEYSPPGAAARVFATVAGVKVGGSALGVAAAGLVAPLGPAVVTSCAAAVCALTLVAVAVDAALGRELRHHVTTRRSKAHLLTTRGAKEHSETDRSATARDDDAGCAARGRAYRRGMPTYTATRPLEGDADEYFDYISDPENLPAYFPRVTEAHELPDGKVETTAHVDADRDGKDETVTSEAEFDVDRAAREVTWSAPGPHDYHGSLRLTDDGVELTIHTTHEFDGMQQALDGSLAKIAENLRAQA
ncbi:SRPBCC family protein [Leifsonia xyli]|uniref:SRPBCC family protein n=1 Tax=Leifsonia xyli TaxID=1575 RepID=UPI003D678455